MQVEHLNSLNKLNSQASERTFYLQDLTWDEGVDHSKKWMPESMLPLSYLPSFKVLPADLKLAINQKYALAICEQFIWFEQELIVPILTNLIQKKAIEPSLAQNLQNVIDEETRHSKMFHLMLKHAAPDKYGKNYFHYFKLPKIPTFYFQRIINNPVHLNAWVWLAVYFEERTLDFSRRYSLAKRPSRNEGIDDNFTHVHELHMIDACC